jgi:hypothetical protein
MERNMADGIADVGTVDMVLLAGVPLDSKTGISEYECHNSV